MALGRGVPLSNGTFAASKDPSLHDRPIPCQDISIPCAGQKLVPG